MQTIIAPPYWEPLLKGYVKRTFFVGTRKHDFAQREEFTEGDFRFFASGVRKLTVAFTQERHSLPKNYFNQKEYRSGYILYFLPVNALKVAALLSETPRETWTKENESIKLHIMDVGSGPGTGMMGTFLHLEKILQGRQKAKLELMWTLIDQNRDALNHAGDIHDLIVDHFRKTHPQWEIVSRVHKIVNNFFSGRLPHLSSQEPADLILMLNTLNEISKERRLSVVENLLRHFLKPQGKVFLMEPALRMTTRDLMELRDQILEKEVGFIYAPCLHQAGCPMLRVSHRDWCHAYIPWERPRWIEKLDHLIATRKEYLKCSYLLIGLEPPSGKAKDVWRVVSGPLNSNGKSERLLCGPLGVEGDRPDLLRMTRLDRDRSSINHDFEELERGDLVETPKMERVGRETKIRRIKI